jgi:hypothetical protein
MGKHERVADTRGTMRRTRPCSILFVTLMICAAVEAETGTTSLRGAAKVLGKT